MRFRLILQVKQQERFRKLPLNYQYELSAVIYHIFASANEKFAEWLHENGFVKK